jgi:alkanesulfonate monooxygenase SsuD/methylene tetrahydromethanopterin reductase-like flavin-dependent oxidoreductase (luciferase family)
MYSDMVIDPLGLRATEAVSAAVAAERSGFDSVWVYDHLSGTVMGSPSSLELWTLLGAIGGATSTIGLGPLVANVTTRHPAITAVAAATLCQLAPGRVTIGLGAGAGPGSPFGAELDMIGVPRRPAAERRQMVADATAVMRTLWAGGTNFEGETFSLTEANGFLNVEAPPIIVGCNGPKMAQVAVECADGANFHSFEEDLPGLIAIAAEAPNDRFQISVEAPQDCDWRDWLHADADARGELEQLGADRVMVVWHGSSGLAPIDAAGGLLQGTRQDPAG